MHQYYGHAGLSSHTAQSRVTLQSPYVINQPGSGGHGLSRDVGLVGVDAYGDIEFGMESFDDVEDATQLLVC
jgi:hypothetical protein